MRSKQSIRKAFIEDSGIYCAAGDSAASIVDALTHGRPNRNPLPFPADWLPYDSAFSVREPDAPALGVDRKALRTMEKQTKLALYGALRAAEGRLVTSDRTRVGLFVGLPTIEEEVPTWSVLEEIHRSKRRHLPQDVLIGATPPFSGLVLLNSTACAHIATRLDISGSMGSYSQFADAGANALIEAALSIVEGENNEAVAGGVSPKINPLLLLQYETLGALGEDPVVPGEATAFIRLAHAPRDPSEAPVCLAGFGRTFAANPADRLQARSAAIERALAAAELSPGQVDWIMVDRVGGGGGYRPEHQALESVFGCSADDLPLCCCDPVTGFAGPATPVLNVAVAHDGLRNGYRLRMGADGAVVERQTANVRHVLINTSGFAGQFVSLVLAKEDPS